MSCSLKQLWDPSLICSYARKITVLPSATQPLKAKDEVLRSYLQLFWTYQLSLHLLQSGMPQHGCYIPSPLPFRLARVASAWEKPGPTWNHLKIIAWEMHQFFIQEGVRIQLNEPIGTGHIHDLKLSVNSYAIYVVINKVIFIHEIGYFV